MAALAALAAASPPPQDMSRRCPGYGDATRLLKAADAAGVRRDYHAANRALDRALDVLGAAYRDPRLLDDSDQHLLFARYRERKGQLADAAAGKHAVLQDRLTLCRR